MATFNSKNTAIKRIYNDVRELQKDPSDQYFAAPLDSNPFEWHFTIRGPPQTEFEGGIYHGRILLPSDYPLKPPNIVFITPNGRFEVNKKICLSISSYHPEQWHPAWGIRLILEALISFLPTKGEGAIGSLDWTEEERRKLAQNSIHAECSKCGSIKDLLPPLRTKEESLEGKEGKEKNKYAEQIAQLSITSIDEKKSENKDRDNDSLVSDENETINENEVKNQTTVSSTSTSSPITPFNPSNCQNVEIIQTKNAPTVDKFFIIAVGLIIAIIAILIRKGLKYFE